MPDAILVSVAAAVTAALNSAQPGTFAQSFVAVRSYADWDLPLLDSDPDQLLVDVVPVPTLDSELATRASVMYSPAVDVIIRQRITPDMRDDGDGRIKNDVLDELVKLPQQVADFFTADRFAAFDDAAWFSTEIRREYVPTHLHKHHQYTGIVRLTFKAEAAI